MQGLASRQNHRNSRNDNRRAVQDSCMAGGRHFCWARETVTRFTDTEPAAATRMARVVTPVTRLGRTCDSENAYRYWVCHMCRTCHGRSTTLTGARQATLGLTVPLTLQAAADEVIE